MSQSRSRVTRMFATAAVLTVGACAPERSPTVPVLPDAASLAAGGNGNGGGGAKVKIKSLRLASTSLTVDGPSVVATISIDNAGLAYQGGVSIGAEVAQPAAFREAANVLATCVPGQPGALPNGTCTMSFDVVASSSTNGAGTFTSGAAVLRVRVLHTGASGTPTELATRTIDVSLVVVPPPTTPSITSLSLASTTLTINGPKTTYIASLKNPGPALQNLTLQGYIVQGENRYGAGGVLVTCGGLPQLPTGTCDVSFTAGASTVTGGPGPLEPGPAVFELQLLQTVPENTVLDTETVDVTLVAASPPIITSILPAFTQLMIGGRTESATIAIDNSGPPRSTVLIKGWIVQGVAREVAIDQNVECGGVSGVLPSGACMTKASVSVDPSSLPDPFGIKPGPATLEVQLMQTDGTTETKLDTKLIPVTLVENTPWIANSTVQPTIEIGPTIQVSVTVTNLTGIRYLNSDVTIHVIQGAVSAQVGSATPGCGADGEIAAGDCVIGGTMTLGTTFVPGPARLELRLTTDSGARLLDVKHYDVTLTAP